MPKFQTHIVYHIPCPKCGSGVPVELERHDYTPDQELVNDQHLLKSIAFKATCAAESEQHPGATHTFTVSRDERGSYDYAKDKGAR